MREGEGFSPDFLSIINSGFLEVASVSAAGMAGVKTRVCVCA